MISRAQQILMKRAQREAELPDDEYRDALEAVSGFRSSKSLGLTDRHVDLFLAYLEAILWRKVDAGTMQPNCKPDAIFQQRGFWAARNTRQETSRDRYITSGLAAEIARLEVGLEELGFGRPYLDAIKNAVARGHGLRDQHAYKAALQRTLRAKQNAAERDFTSKT